MSILIPIVILGVIMGLVGLYFATHEGKYQTSNRTATRDHRGTSIPPQLPTSTQADPEARKLEQPSRGVPLHDH